MGLVLGGKGLTYDDITADTGWPRRTLQRWMAKLQQSRYIEVRHTTYWRMVIHIRKAKKFNPKQLELPSIPHQPSAPEVAHSSTPRVAHLHTKSGALKEGVEVLSSITAEESAAHKSIPEAWKALGHNGAFGSPGWQRFWEVSWLGRDGQLLSEVMGTCADAWEAIGEEVPPQFFRALQTIRKGNVNTHLLLLVLEWGSRS